MFLELWAVRSPLALFPLCALTASKSFKAEEKPPTETTAKKDSDTVAVFVMSANKTVDIEIFDYIVGAVAAEIPDQFAGGKGGCAQHDKHEHQGYNTIKLHVF